MKKIMGVCLAVLAANSALAADRTQGFKDWYVSPLFSFVDADKDRLSENGLGGYLGVGKKMAPHWNMELGAGGHIFDNDGRGVEWQQAEVKLDNQYVIQRGWFEPYLALGLGVQREHLRNSGATEFAPAADVGVGSVFRLPVMGVNFGLRVEARYRVAAFSNDVESITGESSFSEPVYRVGLVIPLSRTVPPPAEKVVVIQQAPAAAVAAAAPAAPAVPADTDGDGVIDSKDLCPGTPKGELVDSTGCSRNQLGAGYGQERQFEAVLFDTNSETINAAGRKTLTDAAALLKKSPLDTAAILISGHTDNVGSDGYNQALSERRARSVRTFLLQQGINASRISVNALGEGQPLNNNQTAAERTLNRRAEVRATKP